MAGQQEFSKLLQRHRVVGNCAFYLALAWLILQIAEVVAGIWEWPNSRL